MGGDKEGRGAGITYCLLKRNEGVVLIRWYKQAGKKELEGVS